MRISSREISSFERNLTLRGLRPATAAKYGNIIGEFAEYAKRRRTSDQAETMAGWLNADRAVLAPPTVRLRLAACRSWLRAHDQPLGPLARYKAPPLPEPEPHPLPGGIADVRRMLDAAETFPARAVIALGGLAGCRVSESVSLTRESGFRNRHGGAELIIRGKGERIRYVPVSSTLAAELDLMPAAGRLAPISSAHARRVITATAEAAGVRGHDGGTVSSHDLRATFATEIYERTGDPVLVSRLLGHSNLNVTKVYIRHDPARAAAAVEF